jgi:ADP-ribose pyrophosphatase
LHIYLAKVDSTTAQGIHGLASESEDIRVLRVPEAQAIKWLQDGIIDNAAAIIALQWFMLNKSKLIEDWLE